MNNARIVQADDGRFELLWDDDEGRPQSGGHFETPADADTALTQERERRAQAVKVGDAAQ